MTQTKIIYCFDCGKEVKEGECEGHQKAWGTRYEGSLSDIPGPEAAK